MDKAYTAASKQSKPEYLTVYHVSEEEFDLAIADALDDVVYEFAGNANPDETVVMQRVARIFAFECIREGYTSLNEMKFRLANSDTKFVFERFGDSNGFDIKVSKI